MPTDSISHSPSHVSPLASHKGLSSTEIVKDCLEKAKSLLSMLLDNTADNHDWRFYQQLSLLDDLVRLAFKACD